MAVQFVNPIPKRVELDDGKAGNSALQKLIGGVALAQMNNRAAAKRSSDSDASRLRGTGLQYNLDTRPQHNTQFEERLGNNFLTKQMGDRLKALGDAKGSGIHAILPKGGVNIGAMPDLKFQHGDFKGQAQERVKAVAEATLKNTTKIDDVVGSDGKQAGTMAKRSRTDESSLKGKLKGGNVAEHIAKTVIDRVMEKQGIQGDAVHDTGKMFLVFKDGVPVAQVPKPGK